MAEQTVAQLKSDLKKFEEWVAEARRTKTQQKEDRKAENLRRRLNPRTEKDFELVWHALEQWREEQVIFEEILKSDFLVFWRFITLIEFSIHCISGSIINLLMAQWLDMEALENKKKRLYPTFF